MSRKRAAPDLFEDETGPGRGILGLLGHLVSAHPSLAGGSVAFSVIFGFIAANALWHQPGDHPAPILKTREIAEPRVPLTEVRPDAPLPLGEALPARTVTTYRIERNDETPTASIPVPDDAPLTAPVTAPVAQAAPAAAAAPAPVAARPAADPVLSRIQTILAAQGLYSGAIDGLMGPKSMAAIRAWEKANGYAETGAASPALLAAMDASPSVRSLIENTTQAAVPTPAPAPQAAPAAAAPVDLARLEEIPAPVPSPRTTPTVAADARTGEPVTLPAAEIPAAAQNGPSELVRRIQEGLSNIAYADIAVDGVAGAQTRAAIGAFEKHYRLPVTGEPNQAVLDKLLEIGAL